MSEFRPTHIELGKSGNRVYGEMRDGDGVRLVSLWMPNEAERSGEKRHGCDRDEKNGETRTGDAGGA
jgi:hypothetical protein